MSRASSVGVLLLHSTTWAQSSEAERGVLGREQPRTTLACVGIIVEIHFNSFKHQTSSTVCAVSNVRTYCNNKDVINWVCDSLVVAREKYK